MSTMYAAIQQLCAQKGTNITAMCRKLGISRSALSELASGRTKSLSAGTLAHIAAYFEVPVEALLGEPAISPLYFRFAQQAQALALTEQDLQLAIQFLQNHKQRNPGG